MSHWAYDAPEEEDGLIVQIADAIEAGNSVSLSSVLRYAPDGRLDRAWAACVSATALLDVALLAQAPREALTAVALDLIDAVKGFIEEPPRSLIARIRTAITNNDRLNLEKLCEEARWNFANRNHASKAESKQDIMSWDVLTLSICSIIDPAPSNSLGIALIEYEAVLLRDMQNGGQHSSRSLPANELAKRIVCDMLRSHLPPPDLSTVLARLKERRDG